MNTQEIKCFLRVAERLSFSRAAQELYLTPPTVTHHIQKLEEELEVLLFQRNSKSVRLTPEGELFYRDAQEILMKIENAVSHLNHMKKSRNSLLRIGCMSPQEMQFLSGALSRFRERFPDADPRITADDFPHLLRMLKEDHLDVVLGPRDILNGSDSYHFTSLYSCGSCAVFPRDLPARPDSRTVSLKELEDYPLIALRPKNIPILEHDRIEKFLSGKHSPRHVVRQDDAAAVLALVYGGYGIGILPEYVLSHQDLTVLHCTRIRESPQIDYGLIQYKGSKNPCITGFIAAACAQSSIS